MLEDVKKSNEHYDEQKMTKKEKANWVSQSDIKNKFDSMYNDALNMLNKKVNLNYSFLNKFLLFVIMSGITIPPRRSLDYSEMMIKNFDKNKDNYYSKGVLIFQRYKTSQVYGRVEIDLKQNYKLLYELLQKWIKLNPSNYMFFSSNGEKINPSQISKYNNSVWDGRNVSTNTYRHSYITSFFDGEMPSLEQMNKLSLQMGHSVLTQLKYIKNDAKKD
jgi:hypothetical protein